jgi:type IV secretory pathway protease TraF
VYFSATSQGFSCPQFDCCILLHVPHFTICSAICTIGSRRTIRTARREPIGWLIVAYCVHPSNQRMLVLLRVPHFTIRSAILHDRQQTNDTNSTTRAD